jgi:hypothetical protein
LGRLLAEVVAKEAAAKEAAAKVVVLTQMVSRLQIAASWHVAARVHPADTLGALLVAMRGGAPLHATEVVVVHVGGQEVVHVGPGVSSGRRRQ